MPRLISANSNNRISTCCGSRSGCRLSKVWSAAPHVELRHQEELSPVGTWNHRCPASVSLRAIRCVLYAFDNGTFPAEADGMAGATYSPWKGVARRWCSDAALGQVEPCSAHVVDRLGASRGGPRTHSAHGRTTRPSPLQAPQRPCASHPAVGVVMRTRLRPGPATGRPGLPRRFACASPTASGAKLLSPLDKNTMVL